MGVISSAIKQNADKFPEKLAITQANGGSMTYRELEAAIRGVASNLYRRLQEHPSYDFARGNCVSNPPVILVASDSLQSVVSIVAINRLGLTVAPMNAEMGTSVLSIARDAIEAGIVLHDNTYSEKAEALQTSACWSLNISELATEGIGELPTLEMDAEYPYLLTLSSGSTGNPKPVIYTDAGKLRRATFTATEFQFSSADTILCASPFFHSLGQRLTFMPLVIGATMVLLPRFSVDSWLNAVKNHQVTVTICVSSHLFALKDRLIEGDERADSIRVLVSSSASIDNSTKADLFDGGNFDFFEMYGASEVATATRLNSADSIEKRGSVGSACQGVSLKIVRVNGEVADANETGEILVRSPLCTPGYFKRVDLDVAAFEDGWFRTGDLGYLDTEGYLYFMDRRSDVIISGGSNIYPSDVETCLRDHPEVVDCLVIGVNDSYLGEAVIAVIIGNAEASSTLERDLRRHVRGTLASSQQPLMYFMVDEFPLNGAGKVDRKAIRQYYKDLELDPSARFRNVLTSRVGS